MIELIAPSGYPPELARAELAVKRLQDAGHVIVSGERLRRKFQRFGGTDAERLSDINALGDIAHRQPDIALAVRGGYGLTRLLGEIHYEKIARRLREKPTLLVGHSDFTALQLALLARAGAVTFSGPMLNADFGGDEVSEFTWNHFWRLAQSPEVKYDWMGSGLDKVNVSGTLWGGNLTMLCSLLGTPYFPSVSGGILFVEDVNEPPFRVERLLYQLHLSGVLGRQQALLLGSFSECRAADYDNGYGLPAVVQQIHTVSGVPIVCGLPFGHCFDKVTLPVGADGELSYQNGRASLRVSNYPWLLNIESP